VLVAGEGPDEDLGSWAFSDGGRPSCRAREVKAGAQYSSGPVYSYSASVFARANGPTSPFFSARTRE
jgi:hypothetical protein